MALSATQLSGFGSKAYGAPLTYSYLQTVTDSTNATTHTFTTQNFGTAADDRYIVVAVGITATNTTGINISTVTIGGVAASFHDIGMNGGGTDSHAFVAYASVPTGTTGTITYTATQGSFSASACAAYAVYAKNLSVTNFVTSQFVNANPLSRVADTPVGGVTIAAYVSNDTVDGITWTGLTEDVDGSWATENKNYSMASKAVTSPGTSGVYTVTAQANSSTENCFVILTLASTIPPTSLPTIHPIGAGVSVTPSSTTYTFSAEPIGYAQQDRVLLICATGDGGAGASKGISTLTVGGVSATLTVNHLTTSTILIYHHVFYLAVPTGTTADIVLTVTGGTVDCCGIYIHAIYGSSGHPANWTSEAGNAVASVTPTMTAAQHHTAIVGYWGAATDFSAVTNMSRYYGDFGGTIWAKHFINSSNYGSLASQITGTSSQDMVGSLISWQS